MEAIKIKFSYKIALTLLVVIALLTVIMPRKGIFKYTYQKGGTWNYETLVAPFDFPILKTEEEIKNEEAIRAKQAYTAYFKYSESVSFDVGRKIAKPLEQYPGLSKKVIEYLTPKYTKGIYSEEAIADLKLEYELNPYVAFVTIGKNQIKVPTSEAYTLATVKADVEDFIRQQASSYDETLLDAIAPVVAMVQPNLLFDKQMTEQKNKESREDISVSLGIFRAGELIIREGDTVTSHDARILDSFKAEFDTKVGYDGPLFLLWLGDFLLAVVLTFTLLLVSVMGRPSIFDHFNELTFILTMFVLSSAVTFTLTRIDMTDKLFLVPFPVFALYLVSFFRNKLAMPVYVVCLVPLLVSFPGGTRLFLMFLFAGCISVMIFSRLNKGWHQFIAALFIFLSLSFVYTAFALIAGSLNSLPWTETLYMLLGSLFVVLAYPLVYLFEIIFNLVSDSRLTELSDTNNKLLRELGQKAPGTFQHSIAVMNMADFVGKTVTVDVPLLRAGALYHDVGKIENPMCFVENQVPGVSYHDKLAPKESAGDIIRHVTDGLALAQKYRLPKVIKEFIASHHGTSNTGYFYTKYLNDGGDPSAVAEFFYPGPAPKTKEQVILMLCDTVDAASRTISSFDYETVSPFIDKIFAGKFEAGQLQHSEITMAELETVREALKQYIVQLHHGRIAYPERKVKTK